MSISIGWGNRSGMTKFAQGVDALGSDEFVKAANRAVNKTGDKTRTAVRRALVKQTGLKRPVIVKAIKVRRSSWRNLTYTMTTRGGNIALKYFNAKESRKGVRASPFGKRTLFPGSFIKGGRFPGRVPIGMGGHVFQRTTKARTPVEKQLSGVFIPKEMVKGQSAAEHERASADLDRRMAHEVAVITKGIVS